MNKMRIFNSSESGQIISFSHVTRDHWQVCVDEREKDDVNIQYITPDRTGEALHWLVWVYASEACRLPGLIGRALAMLEQRKRQDLKYSVALGLLKIEPISPYHDTR